MEQGNHPAGSNREIGMKSGSPSGDPSWKDALRDRARVSGKLSWLLDECIRIPGTGIRFGIDPLLGLVPYGGEAFASLIGIFILGEAGRKGLPVKTLLRMGGNTILNAGVGAIPVIGDLFSFWFKSNTRNYKLLEHYLESEHGHEQGGGWWPLLIMGGVLASVVILNVLAWIALGSLFYLFWNPVFRGIGGS